MNPPLVSVIIPVRNGAATIGHTLDALQTQAGLPGPFEIIVVDNGSTDQTAALVAARGITVLHQPKPGPSAARNLGAAQARAPILVFTDCDTVPTRRWLAGLHGAFSDPAVMLATSTIESWQPATAAERYVAAHKLFSVEYTANNPNNPFAYGMNFAIRRQALAEVGGWDETMGSGEDVDLSARVRQRYGCAISFVSQAVLFHKHRSTDQALWKQARWHGAGHALVLRRHPDMVPWPLGMSLWVRLSIAWLYALAPLIAVLAKLRLVSPQRVEFERYHRNWQRHFWGGFFQERKVRRS